MRKGMLFFLIGVSSCTTSGHVRESAPTRVEIIQENYQNLAMCVAEKIEKSGVAKGTRLSIDEADKRARVVDPFGFIHNTTAFEFLFIHIKDKETKVESYGLATLVGRDHYPNQIWPYVCECAGQKDSQAPEAVEYLDPYGVDERDE